MRLRKSGPAVAWVIMLCAVNDHILSRCVILSMVNFLLTLKTSRYKLTPMNDKTILEKIGATGAIADALGQSSETISNWKRRGIPARWKPSILAMAKKQGIEIDVNQFLGIPNF